VGGTVEDGEAFFPGGDLLCHDLQRDAVALANQHRAAAGFDTGHDVLHAIKLLGEQALQFQTAVLHGEDFQQRGEAGSVGVDAIFCVRLFLRQHGLEVEGEEALLLCLLRLGELLHVHVGMHEVLGRVVDAFELAVQLQGVLHHHLELADPLQLLRVRRHSALAALLHRRADEFIQHGVVAFEAHVQGVKVCLVGDVDGPNEIDLRTLGRFITHHGRLQAIAGILLDKANEVRGFFRTSQGGECERDQ